ncbi:hypothetical protein [Caballeronia grimmiae]|uniref:hypothetical protein n=1 Tax=Caballeronia grimmiae TaxID=1071679 RepID=UPI0038BD3A07
MVVDITTRRGGHVKRRIPLVGRFSQVAIDLVPEDLPDWLMWAAADVDMATQPRVPFGDTSAYQVWARLWASRLGTWRPVDLAIHDARTNAYAKQFELELREPSLLQIGGPQLPSRFISLPDGRVRVLLTAAQSAFGDPLHVVVSRIPARPRNTLLSLLSMTQLLHATDISKELLGAFHSDDLSDDALSGCALGYAAIRLHLLDRFALADAERLFRRSLGRSDAAILLAARELAESTPDFSRVIALVNVGIGRGTPVLAQSMTAARVALNALRRRTHRNGKGRVSALEEKVRSFSEAQADAGPFLSFYGAAPHCPGKQQEPRNLGRNPILNIHAKLAPAAPGAKPSSATMLVDYERSPPRPHDGHLDALQ